MFVDWHLLFLEILSDNGQRILRFFVSRTVHEGPHSWRPVASPRNRSGCRMASSSSASSSSLHSSGDGTSSGCFWGMYLPTLRLKGLLKVNTWTAGQPSGQVHSYWGSLFNKHGNRQLRFGKRVGACRGSNGVFDEAPLANTAVFLAAFSWGNSIPQKDPRGLYSTRTLLSGCLFIIAP